MKHSRHEGFTLIELLIVITIIAILAGLVLSTAGYVQKKGARSRAEAEIAAMGTALENYKADFGDYPTGSSSVVLLTNLMPPPGSGKVYFEFKKNSTNSSGWLDPFGNAYSYRYPGLSNQSGSNFFDLWSTAGGGASNTWIRNW
ncbi:MAG: PilD-dependent protein PddA [Verrucomicrobiota bacterium]|jgi:general secretion pathway protein G